MKSLCAHLSRQVRAAAGVRLLPASLAILVIFCLASTAAFAQCTLSSPDIWSHGGNGNWGTGTNWSGGLPTGATNTCITDGTSAVTLDVNGATADLQLATGNSLNFNLNTQLTVNGPQILNNGQININGGAGTNTVLLLGASSTLSGTGTMTLTTTSTGGGSAIIEQAVGGLGFTNQSTIQGEGIIGNNGLGFANTATGIVNANSTGGPLAANLFLQGISGTVTNAGLFEASNSGILSINGETVSNTGGNITANGANAMVQLYAGADIQGGTLTNNGGWLGTVAGYTATLDGTTNGALNLHGTYTAASGSVTTLSGTINNNNVIQVNGGNGANAVLQAGNNLTLQGGGTLNLSTIAASGGSAILQQATGGLTLTNVNNIIQGEGIIGNNGLTLINQKTIDANSALGGLSPDLYLQGLTGLTNTGLLEATNNGILHINGVVVNNAGANITANGANTMVQLYAGTDIQGGTLTNNGGWLGTVAGYTATLDGTTNGALNLHGTYTAGTGSVTTLSGTINNNNLIQVNGGNGANAALQIGNNLTLQGGGTLNLSTIAASGGSAYLQQATGGLDPDQRQQHHPRRRHHRQQWPDAGEPEHHQCQLQRRPSVSGLESSGPIADQPWTGGSHQQRRAEH